MLASGGIRYQPRLVDRVADPDTGDTILDYAPRVVSDQLLDPSAVDAIEAGLVWVPREGGTGEKAFRGFPLDQYPIAGKTGTAQVNRKADFSLFAGYGPVNSPQYAVAAVLEQAGFGGDAAAPAVRRFFELLGGFTPLPAAPLAGEPDIVFPRSELIGDEPSLADSAVGSADPAGDEADQ